MALVHIVRQSFKKAKDDVEGVKNELAFALKRIAKIEELLNRQAIEKLSQTPKTTKKSTKKPKSPKIKRKILEY